MRFFCLFFAIFLFSTLHVFSDDNLLQNSGVKVRTFIDHKDDIYVGQLIKIWVEVTTPTWFVKAPQYPEITLDGAIVLIPEQLAVNFSTKNGGAGQRQRYAFIPQREGTYLFPPVKIDLTTSMDGKPSPTLSATTEPLRINVVLPPGTATIKPLVTTAKLTVKETYDRSLDNLRVGEALERSITLKGANTFGLALPPISFESIRGIRNYQAQPEFINNISRGQYSGSRIDRVTYVLEEEGKVEIPGITIQWWNPESKSIDKKILPSKSFAVLPNPKQIMINYAEDDILTEFTERIKNAWSSASSWIRKNISIITMVFLGTAVLWLVMKKYWVSLHTRISKFVAEWNKSERMYFYNLTSALRSDDTTRARIHFWKWLDRLTPTNKISTIENSISVSEDNTFKDLALCLESNRYSRTPDRDTPRKEDIFKQLRKFRKNLLRGLNNKQSAKNLAKLNPRSH